MKEEFDFDKVGKRMPYKVPSDFFANVTQSTLAEAERRAGKQKQPMLYMWRAIAVAASLVLLLTVGYFAYTSQKASEPTIAATENNAQHNTPAIDPESPGQSAPAKPEAVATAPEEQTEPATRTPDTITKPQTNQLATASKPETLDDVLSNVSDEELMLLAAVAETDLNVYEQTFE